MPGVTVVTTEMLEASQATMDTLMESDPYLGEQELAFRRHVQEAPARSADAHEPSGQSPGGNADGGDV